MIGRVAVATDVDNQKIVGAIPGCSSGLHAKDFRYRMLVALNDFARV